MEQKIRDNRGYKVIFVSHCILNQNAKVRGIAKYPGVLTPIVELLFSVNVGIIQMPCPEMRYFGAMRWGQVKDQYNSPMFRRFCNILADPILDQVEDYIRCGYQVLGFIMIDGSPVCGLNKVPQPAEDGQIWGGMVWYTPPQHFVQDCGVFCEVLREKIAHRKIPELKFISVPEVDEVGSMNEALQGLKSIL